MAELDFDLAEIGDNLKTIAEELATIRDILFAMALLQAETQGDTGAAKQRLTKLREQGL